MKKTKLFKSLLLAAGMLAGSASAWAQTTTLMEYGTSDAAWTESNLADWTAGGNPTLADGVVTISGGNGSYATSKTIAPSANSIINVQAVWRGASSTGRAFSAGNGSYFRFGNIYVAQNDQDKKHGYGFTGIDNIGSSTTFAAGNYRVDVTSSTWLLIEAEINTASNTLTSFTIKSEDGKTTYAKQSNIALSDADYTTVAFGYHKTGSVGTTNKEQLKSVKITETVQTVTTADYTVKYVCNGADVKEAVTRTGVVGDNIVLNASDTENFYANDKKYIYVSNDVEGKTVAEGAVVTVTFREAEKYAWTAKSSVGNYTTSGEVFEGDKASAKYPLYVNVDGTLWTKATAGNASYAVSFDVTENNQEYTIDYTETEITDVVFLAEMEDVEGMAIVDGGNAAARSSQRAAGYSESGNTKFATLPQGKYKMTARFFSPTSVGGKFKFYTGLRSIFEKETGNANATDATSEAFVLAQENNEILLGQCGATAAVDFVYIQSAGTPTEEELAEAAAADEKADKAARVFNIIGIGNDWDTDHQMTQSSVEGEEDIYTFTTTMNVVGGEADEYFGYKLRQDSDWNGYQLPQNGNQSWKDQVDGIGKYTLTFTADVANNTLECEAVKADFTYAVVGSQKVDGNDVESDLFDGSWNTAATTDILTKGSDGKFTLSKKVALTAQYVEFKVVAKDGDDVLKWFGNGTYTDGNENNANYNFTSDGTYQVIFSFDGSVVSATAVKEETFTVAGCYKVGNDDQASFFGTAWDPTAAANNMILKEDGIYELKFTDVELTETGTITYKVVKDNAWGTAYPSSDATWGVAEAGIYDITFTFDPTNNNAVACNLAIKKDITSAGYATYCSSYAIDFASAGLSAYIAKIEGSAVTFAPIDDAPANTGVLLKGAEGSYKLPIVGSTTSDVNGNILVGTVTGCTAPANSFVLMDGTSGVGFYKATNAFNVGAHTAYIPADVAGARTFIAIEGEATGIEGIAAEKNFNGEIYNLQGQRVVKAQKGLYIINGKKVLVK